MLLSPRHRIAFAASCCERLLPNYEAFVVQEKWGKRLLLRSALDKIWKHLEGQPLSREDAYSLMQILEDSAPSDLENDFHSIFLTAAQEAIAAVNCALECCLNPTEDLLMGIFNLLEATLEEYSSLINAPLAGRGVDMEGLDWVQQSPLYKAEEGKKYQDLELLRSHKAVDAFVIETLRQSAAGVGVQPFLRRLCFEPVGST